MYQGILVNAWRCSVLLALILANERLNAKSIDQPATVKTAHHPIAYTVAQHYFIKNDVSTALPLKITTAMQLAHYFGQAVTDTQPTTIDFVHNYVIAIDYPVTYNDTHLSVLSLYRHNNEIVLNYAIHVGQPRHYQIHPCLLLILPRQQQGRISLIPHLVSTLAPASSASALP